MQELEKILEEIDETIERCGKNPYIDEKVTDLCYGMNIAKDIIRKHMNDGWIPVEERLPEDGQEVLCCDDMAVYLVEYQADWDAPFSDLDGIIAWSPIPEPYRPERRSDEKE